MSCCLDICAFQFQCDKINTTELQQFWISRIIIGPILMIFWAVAQIHHRKWCINQLQMIRINTRKENTQFEKTQFRQNVYETHIIVECIGYYPTVMLWNSHVNMACNKHCLVQAHLQICCWHLLKCQTKVLHTASCTWSLLVTTFLVFSSCAFLFCCLHILFLKLNWCSWFRCTNAHVRTTVQFSATMSSFLFWMQTDNKVSILVGTSDNEETLRFWRTLLTFCETMHFSTVQDKCVRKLLLSWLNSTRLD